VEHLRAAVLAMRDLIAAQHATIEALIAQRNALLIVVGTLLAAWLLAALSYLFYG
jgi:hypothetical protein